MLERSQTEPTQSPPPTQPARLPAKLPSRNANNDNLGGATVQQNQRSSSKPENALKKNKQQTNQPTTNPTKHKGSATSP